MKSPPFVGAGSATGSGVVICISVPWAPALVTASTIFLDFAGGVTTVTAGGAGFFRTIAVGAGATEGAGFSSVDSTTGMFCSGVSLWRGTPCVPAKRRRMASPSTSTGGGVGSGFDISGAGLDATAGGAECCGAGANIVYPTVDTIAATAKPLSKLGIGRATQRVRKPLMMFKTYTCT
jgi:hypothetical protein